MVLVFTDLSKKQTNVLHDIFTTLIVKLVKIQ
jgi:hypothetical protein